MASPAGLDHCPRTPRLRALRFGGLRARGLSHPRRVSSATQTSPLPEESGSAALNAVTETTGANLRGKLKPTGAVWHSLDCGREDVPTMDHHRLNGAQGADRAEHLPEGKEASNGADEPLSDREQTLADNEQTLADRDQTQSDRDQQASEDDQHAADWDVEHGGDPESHRRTTEARGDAARERGETSQLRDRTAQERDLSAETRDELSLRRDQIAEGLDEQSAELDGKENLADRHTLRVEELRARARQTRARAARDRIRATGSREQAARDRDQAARDRAHAAYDREHAATDELTGTRRRGVGLEDLEREMARARREDHPLVAAYVDIDGLKALNDEHGHAAGDALLSGVAAALKHHMRPYDLLIRLGGDEFLCVLPLSDGEARLRFDDLHTDLNGSGRGHSVSVGFSELRDGDTADDFIARADRDLLAHRRH
jgi:diguanylate cyclase (GGDEF)-like protein